MDDITSVLIEQGRKVNQRVLKKKLYLVPMMIYSVQERLNEPIIWTKVGAGNWTQVLWKANYYSYLQIYSQSSAEPKAKR